MPKKPNLRLVAPAEDDKPKTAPPVTDTGGEIQDIVTLPPGDRDRVSRIVHAATAIKPMAGIYTTRSARVLAAKHLDNIIEQATALRANLPL